MAKETLEEVKDLSYWKANAEEDYIKVPISVLRYISELEERSFSLDEIKTAMKNGYGIKTFSEHTFLKNLNNLKKNMMEETLEEVAEKYVDNFEYGIAHPRRVAKNAFINGDKWQMERSYSEEEVHNIIDNFYEWRFCGNKNIGYDEWFEQFKKRL